MRIFPVFLLLSSLACSPSQAGDIADDVLTRVLESRQLRVCIWPDYYSITYRDPRTHQLSGIDIDLAGALAQDIGPDIKLVFVDSSFASLVDDLHQTRCDIAMFADRKNNTVNVHVSNLRRKIKEAGAGDEYIRTVYGIGFKLE